MSNTIRPKISEAIKHIASSDSSGNSKARIDTQKEFKALQDYLSGNYEELNATERNSVQRLLDNAKEYLKNTIGNVEQNIENEGEVNPKDNEDSTNKKPYETDTSGEQYIGNEDKVNPNGDDDSTNKKPYDTTNTSGEQYIEKEGKVNQKDNEDLTNKKPYDTTDTSGEQYIEKEDKQTSEGPGCIMPPTSQNPNEEQIEKNKDGVNPNDKNNDNWSKDKPLGTDNNTEQTSNNEGKINPNVDDDSTIKDNQETNAYQQNKIPGKKVIHNGKMCIKTPNGNLYDMQGRRIK